MIASSLAAWPTLLSAAEAGRVRHLLAELAEAEWQHRDALIGGLSSGPAGVAIFLGHLSKLEGFEAWRAPARELLEQGVAQIGTLGQSGLYAGFTGVAWAVEHLQAEVFGPEPEDPNAEVDEVLLDHLDPATWEGSYDLISGLVGYGVYALARAHRASGRALLERVLDLLDARAIPQDGGVAWMSEERDWSTLAEGRPWTHRWNLGVAHGIPGVLGLLASLAERGIGGGRAVRLHDAGMAWLRTRIQPEPWPCLPAWVAVDEVHPAPRSGRVAWCYGDLGASVVLLGAARRLGRAADERWALEMGRRAAARPIEGAGLRDACLCHGSFGNAHLFLRLHGMTGEVCHAEAARAYFREGLGRHRRGEGFGGFVHELPPVHGLREEVVQEASAGLLEGAAGIGLAMLSALGGPGPTWDRCLLPA